MKKTVINQIAIISIALAAFMFSSCDFNLMAYNPGEAFYRLMNVERRAREIKKLNKSICETEVLIETNRTDENKQMLPVKVNSSESYDVFVITDVHVGCENIKGNGPRREADWFKLIETGTNIEGKPYRESVKFVICLGDIADHGYLDECERYNKELRDPLENVYGIPLYNVVGNHDLYSSGWTNWEKTMFPHTSFYKFETPSFSWYFLDSASGTLGEYQLESLEKEMTGDSKKKLIFTHVPVYADNYQYFVMQNVEERNKLINICAKTSANVFLDGHTHKNISSDLGAFKEQNIPGFLATYKFAVLHVDEKEQTVSVSISSY